MHSQYFSIIAIKKVITELKYDIKLNIKSSNKLQNGGIRPVTNRMENYYIIANFSHLLFLGSSSSTLLGRGALDYINSPGDII